MATIARLNVLLDLDDNTFAKGLESSRSKLDSWGQSLRNIGTKLTAGVTAPLIAAGIGLVKWGADLENTMATTEKVFGSATDQVMMFSDSSAKMFGIAKQDALDYQIYFAGMLDQIAEGPVELANMSTELTKLTADFGAFFNLTNEEAFTVIQSALAGETEAIRRYGVDVSAAAVETKALELGLAATTAELTEQDKALARYHLIMEQTTHMQGQFGDEADSITGKTKILQARFKDLGTSVSRHLLPYADDLLGVAEDLMGWLESLSPATQRWVIGIAAAAAALGPLLIAMGLLLPALGTGLGFIAAMISPIGLLVAAVGLLAFAFRDELAAGLDWLTGRIQFAINVFQNLRAVGLSPVQAALQTLAVLFPEIANVIAPLRQAVDALADAFQALRDGDYATMFSELGRAARSVGSAIWEAITSINWEGIRSSLWNGIQGAVSWIGNRALEIPSITVDIAKWVAGKIADVWDFLTGHVFGGNKGDGTGGATDPGFGGVTIASAAVSVLNWIRGQIADIWEPIKGWVMSPTGGVLALTGIVMNITNWGNPVWQEEPTTAIAEALGDVVVPLAEVGIAIASWAVDADWEALKRIVVAGAVGVLIGIAAITVAVPLTLVAGAIAGGLLGAALAYFLAVWALNNPGEAVQLLVDLSLLLDKITNNLPSASEIIEDILNFIVPGGGSLIVNIPVVFRVFSDGPSDEDIINSGAAGAPGKNQGGGGGGWELDEFGQFGGLAGGGRSGGGGLAGLAEIGRQIAEGLDNIKNNVIQPKTAEWTTTFQTGVAPLSTIAAAAFNAIPAVATPAMVTTGSVVGTQTSFMNTSASTNWAMMLGSAVLNFAGIRTAGTVETTSMAASVGSNFSQMQADTSAKLLGMKAGAAANFLSIRSNATSEASTTNANVNSQFSSMVSRIGSLMALSVSVVRSYAAQWPGAFSGIRGSMYAAGADAIQGLVDGARSRLGGLMAVVAQAIAIFNAIPALGNSPWPMMIDAGHDAMDGLRIGVEDRLRPLGRAIDGVADMFSETSPRFAGVDMSGIATRDAQGSAAPEVKQYFFALTSQEFKALLQKAEDGSNFAHSFGPELAMQMGVS